MTSEVILVPGLWVPAAVMTLVAARLQERAISRAARGESREALPGDNDGVVCVDETMVEGMSDRALVPAGHSMLAVSGRVSALVEHFLSTGRFA